MLKYYTVDVTFTDIPGEITLEFGISNCPFKCEGCHSPFLQSDVGKPISFEIIVKYLKEYYPAVSCLLISGGDANPKAVEVLCKLIKRSYPYLKTAWFSGREQLPENIDLSAFDYVKLGPYKKDLGGLDSPTTNQRLYIVKARKELIDITNKYWK
ncbi:MAG: 4Fe-4S cluster-binding domain-containing protein [Bacilli bacterium]|nr:4Fe-4S cluster-binding domain-containing protein [Bacilli bacterium]